MNVMRLINIADIRSGHHTRGRIEPREDGSHLLLQARDADANYRTYRTDTLIRFKPEMSNADWVLKTGDVLFMARGVRNYSVLLREIPDSTLAAACFFVVRVSIQEVLPGYLCWYLNQPPVDSYLRRHSGRGVHMPVVKRSVLENIDMPIPPLEIQQKIVELDGLMQEEQGLLCELADKRKTLLTAACLSTIRDQ